ncbi:MAG: TolC family protein [Devosia sp.]|nr:TolC family protein [Devosia sp.]
MLVHRLPHVLAVLLMGVGLASCSPSSLNLAPASATTPYNGVAGMPALDKGTRNFAAAPDPNMPIVVTTPTLNSSTTYSLPQLINIAQLASPTTRAAWQRAREAAAATGVAEATYLPVLSADVLAGFAVTSTTAPGLETEVLDVPIDIPNGTITTSGVQVVPAIAIEWLLFDFGSRDAALATSQQLSFAANLGFTLAHQKLIFDVSNAYYQYTAARAQTRINREALDNVKVVLAAAEAKLKQGLATTMEVATAKQQVAQAEFDLTQALGQERSNQSVLLGAMGVSPLTNIKVQDISGKPLPSKLPANLDRLIIASLQRRPDVQAAFAQMKASEQGILAAQANFMPKVALTGNLSALLGTYSVDDSRFDADASLSVAQPNAAVLLGVTLPVFDGGLRESQLQTAQANAAASAADFNRLQSTAAQEIVVAYDALRTSLSGYAAATQLVDAARTNYDAAVEYYRTGIGTLPETSVTQAGLLKAQYAQAQARSNAFSAAAALAFATGTLTSAQSL